MKNTLFLISLVISSCLSHKVGGKVEHEGKVSGETQVVIKIDISGCMELSTDEAKLECINALVDVLSEINESAVIAACVQEHPDSISECFSGTKEEVKTHFSVQNQ
jgi:hypothetical protein